MSGREEISSLGVYAMRSGKRLHFEISTHLEYDHAHVFVVSVARPDGKRYAVRVPSAAIGLLKNAITQFEKRTNS